VAAELSRTGRARRFIRPREIVLEDWAAVYMSAERDVALACDRCLETLPCQLLFGSVENVDLSFRAPSGA